MATLTIEKKPRSGKYLVEVDVQDWERISRDLKMYNPEFLKSIDQSEREIALGKTKRLRSLRDLRSRS